jgi:hypothetical protein
VVVALELTPANTADAAVAPQPLAGAWARDLWHLCARWLRKVLSHTTAVLLCQQHGLGSLEFRHLVCAQGQLAHHAR